MTSQWLTRVRAAPRWLWLFGALAAINIMVVAATLAINHGALASVGNSIGEGEALSEHTEALGGLIEEGAALSAPSNDVFGSNDVAGERARFAVALAEFDRSLAEIDSMRERVPSVWLEAYTSEMDEVRAARELIFAETGEVFSHFQAGDVAGAGAHMARKDRAFGTLIAAATDAIEAIEQSERIGLNDDLTSLQRLRAFEVVLGGFIVLLVLGAVTYGVILIRVWRKSEEIEAARRTADDMNQARSAFLAQMSHELRTPLSSIKSYGEVLREEAVEDGREQDTLDLDVILASSAHLLKMIANVLDASKLEAGKMVFDRVAFDVERDLLRYVEVAMRPVAAANGNSVRLAVRGELGAASTDLTRLRQCLLNLTSNAAKFTQGGAITVHASAADVSGRRILTFAVQDTGVGMSNAVQGRLFQAFQQAGAHVNTRFGGTGLGLYITKQFVEGMGGQIAIASEEGRGSTFTISVPAVLGESGAEGGAGQPLLQAA